MAAQVLTNTERDIVELARVTGGAPWEYLVGTTSGRKINPQVENKIN